MSDGPDNLILALLRQLGTKLDRVVDDVGDLKRRMSGVERSVLDLRGDLLGLTMRMDRIDVRLDRIERRLDLTETAI